MKRELRILLLEDNAADAELILRELRGEGLQVSAKRVWTKADFLAELRTAPPDVILADYALPAFDGLSALDLAQGECPDVPFLLVSGTLGEERAVDALHRGATDYVLKMRLDRLGPAVRRALQETGQRRQRKRAEEELRFRNAILSTQQEASIDGILVVDADARIVSFNRRFVEMWGLPPELVEAKDDAPVLRFVVDQVAYTPAFLQRVHYLYEHRQETSQEEVVLKDGRVFDRHSAPMVGADGHYYGRFWDFRDITERKWAEEALRNAKSFYHSLVEHLPQCVFRKDLEGRFTYVNTNFCVLMGKTQDELLGKTVFDFFPPERAEKCRQNDERVVQTRTVFESIEEHTPAGKPKSVLHMLIAPVLNASGTIFGVQGIFTDITTQRELEAKFLRTQRLESVGGLASGIAHDLNNILTPILMCAPLLRMDLPERERLQLLSNVEQSAQRAVGVIKQLLSFGRGREGQKTVFQVKHLLRDMAMIARETFPRSIQTEAEVASDLWPILGNATQIHQVLLNLCVNARDAMPGGGRLLLRGRNVLGGEQFVKTHAGAQIGPHILIQVSDTGCGIPEAIRHRIFEPFFSTKDADEGSGLGLATVLGIVKDHGGFIEFTSSPGQGTTFDVHLPARPEQEVAGEADQIGHLFPRGRGELILVVDDEPAILAVAERTLSRQGYQVIRAGDGVEGLAQFTSHASAVRAVVTDILMPLMDGTTLCRLLHRLSPATPIIVSTGGLEGQAGQAAARILAELGVRHVLNKPHAAEALLSAVSDVLGKREPADPPDPFAPGAEPSDSGGVVRPGAGTAEPS